MPTLKVCCLRIQVRLSFTLIVVLACRQGVEPRYVPGRFTLALPKPKPKSGTDWSAPTEKSNGRLIPFAPRETFPLTGSARERVWLGPIENSFSSVGLMVLTRFTETFHPG